MEKESVIERFFKKLEFREVSDNTVTTYRWHINKLAKYLSAEFGVDISTEDGMRGVTGGMLEAFQIEVKEQKVAPATQQLSCAVARTFFSWAHKAGIIDRNPGNALVNIKVPHEEQSHLSWTQVEHLMANYHSLNQVRDTAIMGIGFTMGIRVSGIVGLNIGDIHPSTQTLTYRNKGGATVTAYIPEPVLKLIMQYMTQYRGVAEADEPLFVATGSATPKRLSVDAVELIYKNASKVVGVHITPHSARRSCLSRINELRGIDMAQAIAQHSTTRMTERYLYESPEAMAELYEGMKLFNGVSETAVDDVLASRERH